MESKATQKMTMTVDEMAVSLGISRPKAYELVHSKGFPKINVGKRIIIPVANFEIWLSEQAERGAQFA